jgi:hypothetical protein
MLIVKFVLAVGAVLTSGLFALSAYLEPTATKAAMHLNVAPTTSTLLAIAPPVKQVRLPEPAAPPVAAPPKTGSRSASKERTRRGHM